MNAGDETRSYSGFVLPDDAGARAVSRLAAVSAELTAAEGLADIVTAAVTHGSSAIGAAVTTLLLVRGDQMEMVAGTGLQAGTRERWARFAVDDDNPASEAARTGRAVLLHAEEIAARYPSLRGAALPGRSLVSLPLGGNPTAGVLGLTFDDDYLPGTNELDLLMTFANGCGQALRRIEAAELAQQRAVELAFLAEASSELARTLDYRTTLSNVAHLAVPWLADWCSVDIVDDDMVGTVAVAHADAAKTAWAWELQDKYPFDPAATSGSPKVIRTGVSELYPTITDDMLVGGARDPEHLRLMRELNMRSVIVVPLATRGGHVLGAISLIRTDAARAFGPAELALAEDLGRRAAAAVDNARLFEASQSAALQLQRAVLPAALHELRHWEIAAHYAPGGDVGVGGDFYDAIELPGDRLVLVIGDVMGHGVQAAAAMAQIRAAVRAYVAIDPDPAAVVRRIDEMNRLLGATRLVTMVYGVIDAAAQTLTFVNAGHYPPLLAPAGRAAEYLTTPPRLPLGAGAEDRTATTVPFADGDALLLYTDGLIERRGEILDTGLARLVDASGGLSGPSLDDGLRDIVTAVSAFDDDDVTAFAVRRR